MNKEKVIKKAMELKNTIAVPADRMLLNNVIKVAEICMCIECARCPNKTCVKAMSRFELIGGAK